MESRVDGYNDRDGLMVYGLIVDGLILDGLIGDGLVVDGLIVDGLTLDGLNIGWMDAIENRFIGRRCNGVQFDSRWFG